MKSIDLSLYLITDDQLVTFNQLLNIVKIAVDNGVTLVQMRAKNTPLNVMLTQARELKSLLDLKNIPLIINDNFNVAQAIDAAGVHLGQTDISPDIARKMLGENKIIGRSIENLIQAQNEKFQTIVDYYGVGPIFTTQTKKDAAKPLGMTQLKTICKLIAKPVVAIGGIDETNASLVLNAGAAGIALASAILLAENVAETTRVLREISRSQI